MVKAWSFSLTVTAFTHAFLNFCTIYVGNDLFFLGCLRISINMGKVRKRKLNKVSNNVAASNNDEEELPVDCKENLIQTMLDQIQVRIVNCLI